MRPATERGAEAFDRGTPMRSSPIALALLLVALSACGETNDAVEKAPVKAAPTETKVEPTPVPEPIAVPEDPFADDKWEDADTDGAEPTPPPTIETPQGPWPGPCKITYKGGPTVRFKYTDTGGTVRTDADADGTADVCSKFDRTGDHTTKISIDLDCNKKTDLRIEPKLEDGTNLAVAKVTATDDNGGNREMTLVELGLFAGLEPGYALQAKRADVDATIKDGKVTKASIKGEGGTKVSIAYDKDGRVKSLDEDLGGDGTVDRKFTYKYDAKGNPTKIEVTVTTPAAKDGGKPEKKKQTATVDYSCWK
jgi:hypothetical protein